MCAEEQVRRPESAPSIRALAEQDTQAIHEILISRSVIEGTMRLPHAAARETVERLAPRAGTHHLVADMDGRPVGVLELVTWPDEPRHRHAGEVNLVAVHPNWAGRGAGRALMKAAVEFADDWLNLRRLSLVVFVDNVVADRDVPAPRVRRRGHHGRVRVQAGQVHRRTCDGTAERLGAVLRGGGLCCIWPS